VYVFLQGSKYIVQEERGTSGVTGYDRIGLVLVSYRAERGYNDPAHRGNSLIIMPCIVEESRGLFELRGSNMPKYGQVIPHSLSETRLCHKNAVILTDIRGAINREMIVSSGNTGDAFLFNSHLGISSSFG
jgi:hypothetical protein